ncbi:CHAD domain-containing protein [Nitratifractor sp.]
MKNLEIEKKFLLRPCSMKRFLKTRGIPFRALPVEQFYLVSDVANAERYRRIGTRYIHTRKIGGGLVREEWEEEISRKEYLARKAENRGGIIRKERLIFEWEGRRYELDRFHGPLKGLNILEIEFPDEEEARSYRLPELFEPILIEEVTEDGRFSNGALSRRMEIPVISVQRPAGKSLSMAVLHPFESTGSALETLFHVAIHRLVREEIAFDADGDDPETLHRFRIALRKLHILLRYTEHILAAEELSSIRKVLSDGMRRSTLLRDLDVLLLALKDWKIEPDFSAYAEIEQLRETIENERRRKRKEFERMLESESWQEALGKLIDFSRDISKGDLSKTFRLPVILSARKRLKTLQRSFFEKAKKLDVSASSKQYHRVRILAKELRYTLEFFASIADEKSRQKLLKQMKKLQNILGEEHDAVVQRRYLKRLQERHLPEEEASSELVGNLRATLKKRKSAKRREFRKAFDNFEKESDLLFYRLFCGFSRE